MLRVLIFALAALVSASCATAQPNQPNSLALSGLDGQTITISAADLAAGPRANARVELHGQAHVFEGVALTSLLARVGAPSGRDLHGEGLRMVALVSARDDYRVAFSLGELDPGIGGKKVILAGRIDGAPIPAEDGPFQLAVEGDGRGARSVRMVSRIALVRVD